MFQSNVMVTILLSCVPLYTSKTSSISWPGTPPTTISITNIISILDMDLRDEVTRLVRMFDTITKLEINRSAIYLLMFVTMFSSEFCVLEDREAVVEAKNRFEFFLFFVFQTLVKE